MNGERQEIWVLSPLVFGICDLIQISASLLDGRTPHPTPEIVYATLCIVPYIRTHPFSHLGAQNHFLDWNDESDVGYEG